HQNRSLTVAALIAAARIGNRSSATPDLATAIPLDCPGGIVTRRFRRASFSSPRQQSCWRNSGPPARTPAWRAEARHLTLVIATFGESLEPAATRGGALLVVPHAQREPN